MSNTSKKSLFLLAMFAALVMAGCASHGTRESAESQPPAPTSNAGENSGISTTGSGNATMGQAKSLEQQAVARHSIYFDFDKSAIKPRYQVVVDAWAKYLLSDPTVKVQIQGNTDERGTRAYNQALGERRATSVQDALESEGVPAAQLSTTSFGKERPVCTKHAESCWMLNRRADIVRQ